MQVPQARGKWGWWDGLIKMNCCPSIVFRVFACKHVWGQTDFPQIFKVGLLWIIIHLNSHTHTQYTSVDRGVTPIDWAYWAAEILQTWLKLQEIHRNPLISMISSFSKPWIRWTPVGIPPDQLRGPWERGPGWDPEIGILVTTDPEVSGHGGSTLSHGPHQAEFNMQQVETRGLFGISTLSIHISRFPEMEVPPSHPFMVFPCFFFHINHPSSRVPPFMDTPICIHLIISGDVKETGHLAGKSAPGETSQARQGQQQDQIAGRRKRPGAQVDSARTRGCPKMSGHEWIFCVQRNLNVRILAISWWFSDSQGSQPILASPRPRNAKWAGLWRVTPSACQSQCDEKAASGGLLGNNVGMGWNGSNGSNGSMLRAQGVRRPTLRSLSKLRSTPAFSSSFVLATIREGDKMLNVLYIIIVYLWHT